MNNKFLNNSLILKYFSFLLPFILYASYYINSFYHYGASVLDSGWFIFLATNFASEPLQNPSVLFPTHLGLTYLNTHFSFIFILFSFLYKFLFFWIFPEIYLSFILSLFYSILSFSIFLFLSYLKIDNFLALIVSLLVAFNSQSLAMVGFAHFEIAIPSLIILFFVLYIKNQKILSTIVFILLLSVREDAGFHFFGLIFIFVCIEYIKTTSIKISRDFIKFAFVAFAYSIIVIFIQKSFFQVDDAFIRVYAGTDFFSHINREFISNRMEFFLYERKYLYIPIIILVFLSFLFKNPYLLVPILSILPWTILSICAITDMPGTLSNYYAFVFVLIFGWIPIAFFFNYKIFNDIYKKQVIFTVLSVVISSISLFPTSKGNVDPSPWQRVFIPNKKEISYTHKFKNYLNEHKSKLGNILFDEAMSLFAINSLQFKEYLYINTFSNDLFGQKQREDFTTLIFKENSSKKPMYTLIKEKKLINIYKIKHTDIIIASLYEIPQADFLVTYYCN